MAQLDNGIGDHGEHSLDEGTSNGCEECIASEREEETSFREREAEQDRRDEI